jgi:hypothetical protein
MAAEAQGYTVKWGEYANGTEWLRVGNDDVWVQHVINSDTAEKRAAAAIMRMIETEQADKAK